MRTLNILHDAQWMSLQDKKVACPPQKDVSLNSWVFPIHSLAKHVRPSEAGLPSQIILPYKGVNSPGWNFKHWVMEGVTFLGAETGCSVLEAGPGFATTWPKGMKERHPQTSSTASLVSLQLSARWQGLQPTIIAPASNPACRQLLAFQHPFSA